jgi:hypothetical protein
MLEKEARREDSLLISIPLTDDKNAYRYVALVEKKRMKKKEKKQ